MAAGLAIAIYVLAAALCSLLVVLLMRWAQPVAGELSPRLRSPGKETLVVGSITAIAMLGLACLIGAFLASLG